MTECTHAIARPLSLVRHPSDGDDSAGVSVWTWSAGRRQDEVADRFVVATEPVPASWQGCVDVVLATRRETIGDARAVPVEIGCALVATSVTGHGTVLQLHGGRILVVPARVAACGICLYPWLVLGADLTEVTGHRLAAPATVPSPRRGSAAH
jgi:hypothetical protein